MRNEYDDDFEQVYTVSDTEESGGSGGSEVLNSRGSLPILVCIGLVVFLPLAFIALIASTIAKSCSGIVYGDIAVPLMFGTILISMFAINKYASSAKLPSGSDEPMPTHKSKKKKKFKNIDEHRGYLRAKGYDIDNDPRFQCFSTPAQRAEADRADAERNKPKIDKKKVADEIELAIEALNRLGFGTNKAKDWVTRGISAGIETSDTQALIKFALSRGASLKSNK